MSFLNLQLFNEEETVGESVIPELPVFAVIVFFCLVTVGSLWLLLVVP